MSEDIARRLVHSSVLSIRRDSFKNFVIYKLRKHDPLADIVKSLIEKGFDQHSAEKFIFDHVFEGNTRNTYSLENISLLTSSGGFAKLIIGSFCSIAQNVMVHLGWNHRTDWAATYYFFPNLKKHHPNTSMDLIDEAGVRGDVIVGNDVWLGQGCTITQGVTIGDGAVVAANAHVIRNVGPYEIVGGNPAQLIKRRFSESQINALLECQWWALPDEHIAPILPYLCSADIDLAIQGFSFRSFRYPF